MKNKKILLYIVLSLGIVYLLIGQSFAAIDTADSSIAWSFVWWVINLVWASVLKFITFALSYLIWFMAWLMTFGILILAYLMDIIFIKVPYIWDILWAQWDIVFIHNVNMITTIILVFSVFIWLFLWGFNYIKSVFDQVTMWAQAWNKVNIFRDIIWKFLVVLVILTVPFSLPVIFKWINTISSWILKMEISAFGKEDQIIIASKPLTSLVELWIWLPAVDWLSSDAEDNEWKVFTSIHDMETVNWTLSFKTILGGIIDKSMFQYWRFVNLALTIWEKSWTANMNEDKSVSLSESTTQWADWHEKWLVIFLFISIFYIVLLYTIMMKLFGLFMSLVTRFINIIMTSMYLSFHIAMLWTDNTRWFWARNIWSFIWDIIVTPVIAAFIWIAIIILWYFVSVIWIWDDSFLYFATWSDLVWYENVLFCWILIMALLFWILNKLNKVVEYVWANFENIISTKWWQWMQDSYATPWEAMDVSSKVWSMWKTVWKYFGVSKAWGLVKWQVVTGMNKMLYWDPILNKLKEEAQYEWVRQANQEQLNQIISKTASENAKTMWNNTKIN